ncbi:MAG: PEP-CTERM sorting domain-containing protein [Thiobacillus sp.]
MPNKTDKKTASRRHARRAGVLAMLLPTLLTPAGTIVAGAAVTAAVVGSVVVGTALDASDAPKSERPAAKARSAQVASHAAAGPDVIPIEYEGQTLIVALAEPAPYAAPGEPAPQPPRFAFPVHAGGAPGAPAGTAPRRRTPFNPTPVPPEAAPSPLQPDEASDPTAPVRPEKSVPDPLTPDTPPEADLEPEAPPKAPFQPEPREPSDPPVDTVPREIATPDTFIDAPDDRSARRHALPEPSVWGLVLLGGAALAIARRRRSVAGAA